MTIIEEVKGKLEQHPIFRERKTRGKFLAVLTLRHMGEMEATMNYKTEIGVESLSQFATVYESYERAWRHVLSLEENTHLRGTDYNDKLSLEKKTQQKLGYYVRSKM